MDRRADITQQRILTAAVTIFSKQGYNGASTRDVARLVNLNEVTIYRHFANKRVLFVAALESELSKIGLTLSSLAVLAQASDSRSAFLGLFELISDVMARHPGMIRLLHFAALEMGEELEPIFRKHLGSVLDLASDYLKGWIDVEKSLCRDPRLLILAFISTAVGADSLFPILWGERCAVPRNAQVTAAVEACKRALTTGQSV